MSGRHFIGVETDSGVKLVYVHNGGYPNGKHGGVARIKALIDEHGWGNVTSTLLSNPNGWSTFTVDTPAELPDGMPPDTFSIVPGYGIRYTFPDKREFSVPNRYLELGTEYIYVLTENKRLMWTHHIPTISWGSFQWTFADI